MEIPTDSLGNPMPAENGAGNPPCADCIAPIGADQVGAARGIVYGRSRASTCVGCPARPTGSIWTRAYIGHENRAWEPTSDPQVAGLRSLADPCGSVVTAAKACK